MAKQQLHEAKKELLEAVELLKPVFTPKKELSLPVVLPVPARDPTNVFLDPEVLRNPVFVPMKELSLPNE